MEQSLLESEAPGKLIVADCYTVFDTTSIYDYRAHKYLYNVKLRKDKLNPNNTYITIFNIFGYNYYDRNIAGTNLKHYEVLKEDPDIKIIWESEMAVNRRGGHGTYPRNKMVVWEYSPVEQARKVNAV